jgi:ATP-dependent DNA helicase RecG
LAAARPTGAPVTPPVGDHILRLLKLLQAHDVMGNSEIRVAFVLKDRRRLRETYLAPALRDHLIEYTLPDQPNSRLQKYRLTAKGRALLAQLT